MQSSIAGNWTWGIMTVSDETQFPQTFKDRALLPEPQFAGTGVLHRSSIESTTRVKSRTTLYKSYREENLLVIKTGPQIDPDCKTNMIPGLLTKKTRTP